MFLRQNLFYRVASCFFFTSEKTDLSLFFVCVCFNWSGKHNNELVKCINAAVVVVAVVDVGHCIIISLSGYWFVHLFSASSLLLISNAAAEILKKIASLFLQGENRAFKLGTIQFGTYHL